MSGDTAKELWPPLQHPPATAQVSLARVSTRARMRPTISATIRTTRSSTRGSDDRTLELDSAGTSTNVWLYADHIIRPHLRHLPEAAGGGSPIPEGPPRDGATSCPLNYSWTEDWGMNPYYLKDIPAIVPSTLSSSIARENAFARVVRIPFWTPKATPMQQSLPVGCSPPRVRT